MTTTVGMSTTGDPNSTTPLPQITIPPEEQQQDFWIGLFLALGSSGFIGVSFICQKLGLLSIAKKAGGVRASDGGHKYLLEWKWWLGMLSMGVGETLNFVAYIFAPASLVTPLGALSVIASTVLASFFLHERLNLLGKIGCCLCLIGSTLVVLHSPKTAEIENMDELLDKVKQPAVIVLAGVIYALAAFSILYLAPRYGSKNVVVYVFICATLGSLTVMGAKGLGVAIRETFAGRNEFTNWLTYVMLFITVFDIIFQINYLNKALDTFNTAVVTPTYYVMFTTSVIVFSAVLLQEFGSMTVENIIGDLCGFFTIVGGIFILNAFKDMDVSLNNLPKAKKDSDDAETEVQGDGYMKVPLHDHCLVFECDENLTEEEGQALMDGYVDPVYVSVCAEETMYPNLCENTASKNPNVYENQDRSTKDSNSYVDPTSEEGQSYPNCYENPAFVPISDEEIKRNIDTNEKYDIESTDL